MNRRDFALMGGAGVAGIFFPRKTEGSDSELLSHEEMAQVILNHPDDVTLIGSPGCFGQTRYYHYANSYNHWSRARPRRDSVGEWMLLEFEFYGNKRRLVKETWFDISNPKLKMLEFSGSAPQIVARHFCRIGQQWREL